MKDVIKNQAGDAGASALIFIVAMVFGLVVGTKALGTGTTNSGMGPGPEPQVVELEQGF